MMRKGRASGFFGVFLIAIGLFLVVNNTGIVDFSFWQYFGDYWPVGLIIAGVAIMYKRADAGFAVLALTLLLLVFYGAGQVGAGILGGFSTGSFPFGVDCVAGSGNVTSDMRNLVEFKRVSASTGVNVYLEKGDEASARVEAEDNIIELVKTEVRGGKLEVYMDRCIRNIKPVNVYVSFQEIEELDAQSAGRIIGRSVIEGENIKIDAGSAGEVEVEVEAIDVTLDAGSAGTITIEGKADNLYADASSSGKINAFELVAEVVDASASSAGVAQVYASLKLKAKATSGGKVQYTGDAEVDEETSSAGVVRKMGW